MSTKEYPNPQDAHPHRCAYLLDDILDATHPWNSDAIKSTYRVFRECMKNKEVNADFEHKPRYLAPRENYEELFDSEKVKEKSEKKREEERILKENLKKGKKSENVDN